MSRRRVAVKREIIPDPKYKSVLVAKFINYLMLEGKKNLSERLLYSAFDIIMDKTGDDALKVFKRAVDNVKPHLEVKSRRVGGANYQIPIEVRPNRRTALAFRWLVNYARSRPEKTMDQRLASELLDAANATGASVKKREDTHKMAEANRAFAHYRW